MTLPSHTHMIELRLMTACPRGMCNMSQIQNPRGTPRKSEPKRSCLYEAHLQTTLDPSLESQNCGKFQKTVLSSSSKQSKDFSTFLNDISVAFRILRSSRSRKSLKDGHPCWLRFLAEAAPAAPLPCSPRPPVASDDAIISCFILPTLKESVHWCLFTISHLLFTSFNRNQWLLRSSAPRNS